MARGFHTTFGAATTDRVTTTLNTVNAQRTWVMWTWRNAGSFNRLLDDMNANANYTWLLNGSNEIEFQRFYTGGQKNYRSPATFTSSVWRHVAFTLNEAVDDGTEGQFYFDGVPVTTTRVTNTATGTPRAIVQNLVLGNRPAGDRCYDGIQAEFAVFDRIGADIIPSLAKGYSPLFYLNHNLVEYVPMLRDNVSLKRGAPTLTGTAVQPHPRVIYPSVEQILAITQGVIPPGPGGEAIRKLYGHSVGSNLSFVAGSGERFDTGRNHGFNTGQ